MPCAPPRFSGHLLVRSQRCLDAVQYDGSAMRPCHLGLLLFASSSSLFAQTVTSSLTGGHVEIGAFRQIFHRTLHYEGQPLQDARWDRVALLVRIGINRAVSLELDGMAWHRGSTDLFPTRDYFDFTFGGGLSLVPWQTASSKVTLTGHFHQSANVDRSSSRYTKREAQVLFAAVASRSASMFHQQLLLWTGPALVVDRLYQYPPPSQPVAAGRSIDNVGAILGASLLVRSHAQLLGQLTFTQFWQGQGGVSILL
jgi:hypothetical protein